MYKFVKHFSSYSEFIRCWRDTKNKHQRAGQSFWNTYGAPNQSFPDLFYEENEGKAKSIAWNHIQEFTR